MMQRTADPAARAADSYYLATTAQDQPRPPLDGSAGCDVAIVGGGLAGLSAALELARRGLSVRVLEARRVGHGASGRNGGQVIHGFACDPSVLEKQLGLEGARAAWDVSIDALDLVRTRIAEHAIDCHWQDGYVCAATSPRKAAALQQWADGLEARYGYPLERLDERAVRAQVDSPRFHGGVRDPRSGHLHPLRYVRGIARAAEQAGAVIHEDTPVVALHRGPRPRLTTARGELVASQVLLAGNVDCGDLAPQLRARVMPVGTYIACTGVLPPATAHALIPGRAAVCDTRFVLDYFRTTPDARLLFGGLVSYSTRAPRHLERSLARRIAATFPQLGPPRIEFAWGGLVDITMNRAPDFGRLTDGAGRANVYYLQGFSGHGLALTGMAGRLVAEAMTADASRFDLFCRIAHRPFPGGPWLRTPALVLGMAWYRMRDLLG